MFGDLYLCQFPFTSGAVSKPRPVLVLFEFGQDVIICKDTSAPCRGTRDVTLSDWKQAGLAKPSVARIDKLVTAETSLLTRRLGQITDNDKTSVRNA